MTHQISPTLAAASGIVRNSGLPVDDDYDAVVEIVAKTLGTHDPKDALILIDEASDPKTAAEIVWAALEAEASGNDDEATVRTYALATPATTSEVVQADPGTPQFQPMTAMLTMIKQIVLPLAEHVVELQHHLTAQTEFGTRLTRLEADMAALSST